MTSLQSKLFDLLIEIDDICKEHGITYYLAAGGALGAVRNGGFLPWDDDIDLYITRDNWEKFKKIIDEAIPENRNFVCEENNEWYCNTIGRYVDRETTSILQSQLLCEEVCGLQVEFFVMDPIPKGEKEQLKYRKLLKVYTEMLTPYFVLNKNIFSINTDFDYKLYRKYKRKSRLLGEDKVLRELREYLTSFDEESCEEYCMRWGQKTWIFPKNAFGTPRMQTFEGRKFPIVGNPELIFRIGYGDDWMYVPDIAEQQSHNFSNDIDEPYQTYTNLYMSLLDKAQLKQTYRRRKNLDIKSLIYKETYERELAILRTKILAEKIREKEYNIEQLSSWLNDQDFEKLENAFEPYYSAYDNTAIKNNRVYIPVSDDYLYIAIMNKVLQGMYFVADKLMQYRENTGIPLSEELQKAKDHMGFCRELSVAIYDENDCNKVKIILADNSQYKGTIDFARAELWALYSSATSNDDYKELLKAARKFLQEWPKEGEIIRFEAFALYKLGDLEISKKRYEDAVAYTRNGFVWSEAKTLFGISAYDGEKTNEQ